MKFINGLVILSMVALIPARGFSLETTLSVTDNDENSEIYSLVVVVDDKTQILKTLYKDTFINSKRAKRQMLNPLDMKTSAGMIIEEQDNYNVINLKSDNFSYDQGGKITIDILYNGITGERKSADVNLARDKTGWKLFRKNIPVSKFHVKVNRVMGSTVGIKTILMQ